MSMVNSKTNSGPLRGFLSLTFSSAFKITTVEKTSCVQSNKKTTVPKDGRFCRTGLGNQLNKTEIPKQVVYLIMLQWPV